MHGSRPSTVRSITSTVIAVAASAITLSAGASDPNPAAPPETSQYAFMIGEWECTTRFMGPDGTYNEGRASWSAEFILDGWAIQDYWVSTRPNGAVFHGTNIRSFNPALGKWECRWLPQGSLEWKHFTSEKIDDTMVMLGSGSDQRGEFLDRNTFHEITDERWSWRKDRSYDDGETWIEGVGYIEARRSSAD